MDDYKKSGNSDDENSFRKIVPALLRKGLDKVDLSMFDEKSKIDLLNAAGEEYLRKGDNINAMKAFMFTSNKQGLIKVGDAFKEVSLYSNSVDAYNLAQSYDKLASIGDFCLKEGCVAEAFKAYQVLEDEERLTRLGDYCLEKERIDFAIDVYGKLKNEVQKKYRLIKIADKCIKDNQLALAARAYELANDIEKLNKVGDLFLKAGLLKDALGVYERANNQIMVQFIKDNFPEAEFKGEYL
jgi:tetratricopeptide (TPR) repeat protein